MRVKFEAVDATGKVYTRSSVRRVYSHCVVIHFAAHPPSKLWPTGVTACTHAEWEGSRAMAERKAIRWRKEPDVEAVEILEAPGMAGRRGARGAGDGATRDPKHRHQRDY